MDDIAYLENPYAKRTRIIGKDVQLKGRDAKSSDILHLPLLSCSQVELAALIKKVRPLGITHAEHVSSADHYHEKRSGMNHVLFTLLYQVHVPYILDLSMVNDPLLLGRMMQNIMLARKAKSVVKVATFAKTKNGCAAQKDIEGMLRLMGMDSKAIAQAFF